MSSSANANTTSSNNDQDNNKCCAKCGARRSSELKLLQCSRCLLVKYCSRDCQTADWKRHKRMECTSNDLPLKACKSPLSGISGSDLSESLVRFVGVAEPKNVLCCCWCCGILLKRCGEQGSNPTDDVAGPFWTPTYGRINSDDGCLVRGKTFPALALLGEPGSTGYNVGVNQFDEATACHFCARALLKGETNSDSPAAAAAEKHIKKCEKYLYDLILQAGKSSLPELNIIEKRLIAKITIEQNPNLSDGELSTGGYMKHENDKTKKKIEIPYNYRSFEHRAFPFLLAEAAEYKGQTNDELMHYTCMRLYSVDKSWREDNDYVVFSILRLAAHGAANAREMIHKLPKPLSISYLTSTGDFSDISDCKIAIIPNF